MEIGGLKPQYHCLPWLPSRHNNVTENLMVDFIVKSKKDTPPQLLCMETLIQILIFRTKKIIKVKKGLISSFLFSLENAKNLVRPHEALNEENKKGMALHSFTII